MESPRSSTRPPTASRNPDDFDALGDCHRDTLRMLAELEMLVARLERTGVDPHARVMAGAIEQHFSVTLRRHHEDEERHVFPILTASGDAGTLQVVARLKQDHAWMAMNWRELWPQVNAIASGQSWYDLDVLREGVEIVSALEREHIELEESWVYPRARHAMLGIQRDRMDRATHAQRRTGRIRMLRAESNADTPGPLQDPSSESATLK
jgi:hemerythrin-like domain-containing protein